MAIKIKQKQKVMSEEELDDLVDTLVKIDGIDVGVKQKQKVIIKKGFGAPSESKIKKPLCPIHKTVMSFNTDLNKWSCQQLDTNGATCTKVASKSERYDLPEGVKLSKKDILIYKFITSGEAFIRQGDSYIKLPKGTTLKEVIENDGEYHPSTIALLTIPIKFQMIEIGAKQET